MCLELIAHRVVVIPDLLQTGSQLIFCHVVVSQQLFQTITLQPQLLVDDPEQNVRIQSLQGTKESANKYPTNKK